MAAGVTIQLKRKSGAFSNGDLAAGELGLNTNNGDLYVSLDGSTVEKRGGDMVKLSTATASSDATVDFTTAGWFDGTYANLRLIGSNVAPATDVQDLVIRFSVASSWQTSGYSYCNYYHYNSTAGVLGSGSASGIDLMDDLGNASNEDGSFDIIIHNPAAAKWTKITGQSHWENASVSSMTQSIGGGLDSASAIDGIRLLFDSGNIASGEFTLYGLK